MNTPIHLWETDHPYYGPEGIAGSQVNSHHLWPSWEAFYEEFGNNDVDMNLVWRWDWGHHEYESNDNPLFGKPEDTLNIYMVQPRKSRFAHHQIAVVTEDEPAIYAYLAKHWETVQKLWAPFTAPSTSAPAEFAKQMRARRIAALTAELSILTAQE